jgi:hypothetical protein
MLRHVLTMVMLGVLVLACPQDSPAQAGKKLKEKAAEDAQKKSWEQVDQINRETDGTRSRNEQARKSAGLDKKKYTGGNVTKRHVLPETKKSDTKKADAKKSDSKKQKAPQKKK